MKSIKYFLLYLVLASFSNYTHAQTLGDSECFNESDAFIGLDRKAWTSQIDNLSESYQIDYTIPEEPPFDCYEIDYVEINIDLSVSQNDIMPDCFIGFWTHVLECDDHDPISCPDNDIFFDMMGLNSSIVISNDIQNGTTLGIDVVVLTVSTNPSCNQEPISLGEFEADLEICVDAYYVPKEIDDEIDLGEDIVVCQDETTEIEGPDGYEEYEWSGPINSDEQTLSDAPAGDYLLEVYDEEGCRLSDDISVIEEESFDVVLEFDPAQEVCNDETVRVSTTVNSILENPDFDYIWLRSNTPVSNEPAIQISRSGMYELIVIDDIGCQNRQVFNITETNVSPAQIDSLSKDTINICNTDSLTLSAFIPFDDIVNYSFEWISGTDTLTTDSIMVFDTGLYILNQYNNLGCPESTDSVFVNFVQSLSAGQNSSQVICRGIQISLNTLLSNEADPNGSWMSNALVVDETSGTVGTDIPGGDYTLNYIIENISPCPNDTSFHNITVVEGGASAGDDTEESLCPGEGLDLENLITGDQGGEYFDSDFIALTDSNLSENQLNEGVNLYYYIIDNQNCANDTASLQITVLESPEPTIISGPICLTDSITVGSEVFGQGRRTGSVPLSTVAGCDSIVQVALEFFPEATGELVVELCEGEVFTFEGITFDQNNASDAVVLENRSVNACDSTVNVQLNYLSVLTENIEASLCDDEELIVNGEVYNANKPQGVETLESVNGCDSIINVNLEIIPSSDFLLRVELCRGDVVEVNGEQLDEDNLFVEQTLVNTQGCDSLLTVEAILQETSESFIFDEICEDETLEIEGTIFSASNPNATIILDNANMFGCDSLINVELDILENSQTLESFELCEGDSIDFNGVWVFDSGIFTDTIQNSMGCDSIIQYDINLINCTISIENIDISNPDCAGSNAGSRVEIVFTPNVIGSAYELVNQNAMIIESGIIDTDNRLVFDALDPGSYTLTILDGNNTIELTEDFEIVAPEAIIINNTIVEEPACFDGDSGFIDLEITGGTPPLTINWNTGADGAFLNNLTAGNYSYTITDSKGCIFNSEVTMNQPAEIEVTFNTSNASCQTVENGRLELTSQSGGSGNLRYSLDGQNYQELDEDEFANLAAGSYTLFVKDENDCVVEYAFNIGIETDLEITTESPVTVTEGDELQLSVNTNFTADSVRWSGNAQLSCLDCLDPVLLGENSGELMVEVFDENGCSVSAVIEVIVTENFNNELFIPNIFQLNSSSAGNDVFKPLVGPESSIDFGSMRIFDRWGNLIFEENGPGLEGWDGYYNDRKVQQGVYIYQVQYQESGVDQVLTGQVTLIQ